jgi:PAS domain S-box-containing protein
MPSTRLRRTPSVAAQMSPSLGTWEGDTLSPHLFEEQAATPIAGMAAGVSAHGRQERRWRLLANTLPQLIWTCRADGHGDFFSRQWVDYTGLPEVVLLGHGWLGQVHDEDRPTLQQQWQATLSARVEACVEFRLRRHDGEYRWFEARVRPVLDNTGQVLKWVGSNTDVEERKRAQAEIIRLNAALTDRVDQQATELRQQERDMQAILDHTPSMMGYWDAQLLNRFANRAYHDWFGIDARSMPGKHIREVIGEDRYRANLPNIEAVLRGEPQCFERSIASPDGRQVRHSSVQYQPDVDEQGLVRGFYATICDVTPIKHAQARVEELLTFIEGVIKHCPVGLAVYQEDGRCVMVNSALAQLLQMDITVLEQKNFRLAPWWLGPDMSRHIGATLADGQSRQIEVAVDVPLQEARQAMCSLARINRQGRPHLLVMAQDITGLKQTNDALVIARDAADAATKAKGAFLANMSHEIRTPMNAIVGLSRLALDDQLPLKARTYLDKVHQSSMALMGILDDVLDYSKIEAGQMRVERVAMNLDEVLGRSVDLFSAHAEQKGLALKVDVASDVPRHVLGDPLRLSQRHQIHRGWADRHPGSEHGQWTGAAPLVEVLRD